MYPDGTVCISILHPPGDDPLHYEKASERWSPVQSVEKILLSVVSMLAGMYALRINEKEPNDESPANVEAAKIWRNNKAEYSRLVQQCVKKSLYL